MTSFGKYHTFLENLWLRLVREDFSPAKLAERARRDGGLDIDGVTDDDLVKLIEGRFSGDWREVGFAFGEMLARYAGCFEIGHNLTNEEIVGWAFAALMVAEAIRHGAYDMEFCLNPFLDVFFAVRSQLTVDEAWDLCEWFFSRK